MADRPTSGGEIGGYHGLNNKQGIEILGKDAIMLNAPEVFLGSEDSDPPILKTKAQDIAGAINELFLEGGGEGIFRKITDSSSKITIENDEKKKFVYNYTVETFTSHTTIVKTIGNKEITTVTNFKKDTVTSITDSLGNIIMTADYDAKTGEVNAYYDADGKELILGG